MTHNKGKFLLRLGLLALLLAAVRLTTAPPAYAQTNRYVDPAGVCNSLTPCYITISTAVAASVPGDAIFVFPGNYLESVDLSTMATPGNITLITVNAAGTPTPGTAAVNPPAGPAFYNGVQPFPGNVTINGFSVTSPDVGGIILNVNSDVTIANVTANNNVNGSGVVAASATGNVTVTNSTADNNFQPGFLLVAAGNITINSSNADGNGMDGFFIVPALASVVTINGSSANGNVGNGFDIFGLISGGDVIIRSCSADGNRGNGFGIFVGGEVTISDSNADRNAADGFGIATPSNVMVTNSTASGNTDDGFGIIADFLGVGGDVTITRSTADGNSVNGINLEALVAGKNFLVYCNNILRNTAGLFLGSDVNVDAEHNWWGDPSGPNHPNNPGGTGNPIRDGASGGFGTVDFAPWLSGPFEITPPCGAPPIPVGGFIVPVSKLELLAPWLGLVALIVVAVAVAIRRRRSA